MPPSIVSYDLQLAKAAYGLSNTWHTADVMGRGGANPKAASSDQIAGWSSEQVKLHSPARHGCLAPHLTQDCGMRLPK